MRIKSRLFWIIFGLLFAAPWIVGASLGWMAGPKGPTQLEGGEMFLWSLVFPFAWLGVVELWKRLFWERVPVTGPSGVQQTSASGLLWEYRPKKRKR